jgi:upstream activation factor subunit UAF30
VKQLWVYIKANELQNPDNKKEILCDPLLKAVFGTEKIGMFRMNKVLGSYVLSAIIIPVVFLPGSIDI